MTYQNPLIWADIPDPAIIRVDDTYYVTSTTMYFTPGCPIMKSKDLSNWEIAGYVYETLESNDHMNLENGKHDYGFGSWASSLRYHNGTYYVVFAAYNTNTTYIFQTKDIEKGPWRKYCLEGIYHDMSLHFEEDDDKAYLVYGAGEIKLVELTSDATAIKPGGTHTTIIQNADITGANSLAEGAHMYKINGVYYIFMIVWPRTGTARRIQVCYRATNIEGPYEGKVVLDDNLGFANAGVAQGGIVNTPEGDWYALLFQDRGAVGRIPMLVPVKMPCTTDATQTDIAQSAKSKAKAWSEVATDNNGWPVFGVDKKIPSDIKLPPNVTAKYNEMAHTPSAFTIQSNDNTSSDKNNPTSSDIPSTSTCDDFDSPNLALQWQWNHNPDNSNWSLTARPGWLRLTTGHIARALSDARNTLTQRTFGPNCTGSIKLDISNMKNGDKAGLAALQDQYGYVAVKMEDGKKYVMMAKAPDPIEQGNETGLGRYKTGIPGTVIRRVPLPTDASHVYLKVNFDFENASKAANTTTSAESAVDAVESGIAQPIASPDTGPLSTTQPENNQSPTDEANFFYSLDGQNWTQVGSTLKMSYRLTHFTGYRFALFNYATIETGGYVDIDWFRCGRI